MRAWNKDVHIPPINQPLDKIANAITLFHIQLGAERQLSPKLGTQLAEPRSKTQLRCCHRWWWQARLGDGLLPCQRHKMTNIAVLEKGWLGGGNTGETLDCPRQLSTRRHGNIRARARTWPGLSKELNYNVMFSPRGVMHMAHTEGDLKKIARRHNANRLQGVTLEFLTREQVKELPHHQYITERPLSV